ncbi:hypothetical protein JAAARDRAFT_124117 [Jaapia argillacea MUCL 33604]|uniref:Phosphoglycerate mutase n=1 Tax=Jaapia argillacea MUCL 33604 TaxID=933084 RepID=A0A067Q256_9AGAM|nr:hypothetical protein JAAARDRAFT_124117 [Jaapia argillacea MUCL 33604]
MSALIYIVRHGETSANRQGIIQGQLDTKLNEEGVEQARLVGRTLEHVEWDAAWTSDLSRAKDLRSCEALRERHMGELQGHPTPPHKRGSLPSSVESMAHFTRRILSWWDKSLLPHIASLPAFPSTIPTNTSHHRVLVTTHGGVINTLIKNLLSSGQAVLAEGVVIKPVYNASVTILEVPFPLNQKGSKGRKREVARIIKFGSTRHLDERFGGGLVASNADELSQ